MPKPPAAFSPFTDHQVEGQRLAQVRQAFGQDVAAGAAHDVAAEEDAHPRTSSGIRPRAGRWAWRPLGDDPVERLIQLGAGQIRHELLRVGEAHRDDGPRLAQRPQRAVVVAAAVAEPVAVPVVSQQRHQEVGGPGRRGLLCRLRDAERPPREFGPRSPDPKVERLALAGHRRQAADEARAHEPGEQRHGVDLVPDRPVAGTTAPAGVGTAEPDSGWRPGPRRPARPAAAADRRLASAYSRSACLRS